MPEPIEHPEIELSELNKDGAIDHIEDLERQAEHANGEALKEIESQKKQANKNMLNRALDLLDTNREEIRQFEETIEKLSTDLETANKQIADLGKNKASEATQNTLEKASVGVWDRYFTDPVKKARKIIGEQAKERLLQANANYKANPSPENAKEVKDAVDHYEQTASETVNELSKDAAAKEKIEADGSGDKWKYFLYLAAFGGLIAACALIAKRLSGCYQYKGKTGQPIVSTRLECNGYYKEDNQSACACGVLVNTCDDSSKTNPYCVCPEVHGQFCDTDPSHSTILYYNYKECTVWSVIADGIIAAANAAGKAAGAAGDLAQALADLVKWFTDHPYVIVAFFGAIALYFIVKAANTVFHVTDTHEHAHEPGGTVVSTPHFRHLRLPRRK